MIINRLRTETETAHKALEQNRYSAKLMSNEVTVDDYAIYLEKLYGFLKTFEQVVLPLTGDIKVQPKTEILANDLVALGKDPDSIKTISEEQLTEITQSKSSALGSLYVMEGSTLGGVVIYKHLHQVLGESLVHKAAYFTVYGEHTGSQWKNFMQQLNTTAENLNPDEIVAGANATFSLLGNWMK